MELSYISVCIPTRQLGKVNVKSLSGVQHDGGPQLRLSMKSTLLCEVQRRDFARPMAERPSGVLRLIRHRVTQVFPATQER